MPTSYGYCRVSTDAQRLDRGGARRREPRERAFLVTRTMGRKR